MYVFQFMDASWRIARMTNTKFPLPVAGMARKMFGMPYKSEKAAYEAKKLLERLAVSQPECFAK